MAVIPGVVITWAESPRIIHIPLAVRIVSAQDLVDTLREAEVTENGIDEIFPLIFEASGKTALDESGTQVGITVVLLNAQIYFEPPTTPLDTGTATANDPDGILLTEAGNDFAAAGVLRGYTILNATTRAQATVLEVGTTTLGTLPLTGGSRNDWQIGDAWTAYQNDQASLEGGNIVAIDDEILQNFISPVLASPNVQVVRTSSSSATLQELATIQYSSYGDGVTIDVTSANTGTTFPVGTPQYPVNNLTDAHAIATDRGFYSFFVRGDLTITGVNFTGHIFQGQGQTLSTLTVDPSANVSNCEFRNATLTGTLDGGSSVHDCIISNLSYVNGYMFNCTIGAGTITMAGGASGLFINCQSGVPGLTTPTIDMGGTGQSLAMRGYNGGITITNRTGTDPVSIDMSSGQVIIDSTVTAGTIYVRGVFDRLVDDSTGTAVIDSTGSIYTYLRKIKADTGLVPGLM